jgi:subtilisin family serine protease
VALIHQKRTWLCVALCLALIAAGTSQAAASSMTAGYMVEVVSDAQVSEAWRSLGGNWYAVNLEPQALVLLAADGIVLQSYEQQTYEAELVPNDPCLDDCVVDGVGLTTQWSVDDIGLPTAWDVSLGADDLVVAVLDAGIRATHQELAGRVFTQPGCGNPGLGGDLRHGTLSAGLIGARSDDGLGIAGVLPRGRMLDVQVLGPSAGDPSTISGSEADIVSGVRCAADAGADVISMSFSGVNTPALADAVAYAQSRGAVLVASAGNTGIAEGLYPAAYPEVVSVAATERSGDLASFSTSGPTVSIAAPGMGLVTTAALSDSSYELVDGTSFSAPLVAGVAALLVAANPGWTPEEVSARLQRTADVLMGVEEFGYLNAAAALTSDPEGYWVVSEDGGVLAFGDAVDYGGAASSYPVVGLAQADADARPGQGYWLVAADGGVFAFGSAGFYGSMGGVELVAPIVGVAGTSDGLGYWLVAADGGVFAFGSAGFYGSAGAIGLRAPVTSIHAPATGSGYLLVATDGGIFTFGDVGFLGSAADLVTISPVVGSAGF